MNRETIFPLGVWGDLHRETFSWDIWGLINSVEMRLGLKFRNQVVGHIPRDGDCRMSDPRTSKITLWHWLNYIYERESNKYKLEGIKMIIQKTTKKSPGIYKWLYTVAGHTVHVKEVTSCTFVYIISAYIQ